MPLGICTIDNNESMPLKYLDGTGTPNIGTMVLAASMPGKCAAPPAPAIIALSPRDSALAAYSNSKSGVRCADTTRASYGISRCFNSCAACLITSQSLEDPITTATRGVLILSALTWRKAAFYLRGANYLSRYGATLSRPPPDPKRPNASNGLYYLLI